MKVDINALRQTRAGLVEKMTAVIAKAEADNDGKGRVLTEDENTAYEADKAEVANLDGRIARALEAETLQASLATNVVDGGKGRAKAFAVPKRALVGPLRGFATREDAYLSGMWCRAVMYNDPAAASWCADHGVAIRAAMTEGSNTAGGYLVPDEFESAIIDLREQYGVARQFARVVPMGRDSVTIPRRTSGLTAYAVGENVEITASDKGWDSVTLNARKWGVLCKWSSELDEDAIINLAQDLASEIAYAFAVTEDDCLWNGDGSPTYHGITGVRNKILGLAGSVVAASGHDTFAEIDANDLASLMAKLPAYALAGAKFYISQPGFALVFQRLAQAVGGLTKSEFAGKTMPSYQGYPIVISQKLPLVATDISDTAMFFFGDLAKAVTMGSRRGVTISVSTDRYFELDQLAIKGTERFDIVAHDLGSSTEAGPLVGMEAE